MNTIELAEYIAYLIQNGNYVAGHAIFNRNDSIDNYLPDKILQEGLIIQDASVGLSFTTRYFTLPYEECLFNLRAFIEDTSSAVIIISIPKELFSSYKKENFKSYNSTSILLELTSEVSKDYEDVYGNPTNIALLPPIYILGYLDTQKNIFIENSNYGFNDDTKRINIDTLKPILDEKYSQILQEEQYNLTKKL